MKFSLTERLELLTRWFHRENQRPLLGFFLDSMYPLHRFRGSAKHLRNGKVEPKNIVIEDYMDDYDRLYDLHERAGGDLLWSAAPFFGIPWVEASLGCGVVSDFTSGSCRSIPPDGFKDHRQIPEFSEKNPWILKMLEFIPALVDRSGNRYPIGVTLMRGISDLLAALYGGENLIFRMLEEPKEIEQAVEKLTEYWIAFGHCLLDNLPFFHGGTGAFFYALWCPDRIILMQEDASALLSPEMYKNYIHTAIKRIATAFDHSMIHLHPSLFIPVDYLLDTEIDVIELHIDQGGPSAAELYSVHRKIIDRKPLYIYGNLTMTDLEFVLNRLPHPGLAINMVVSSPEEAEQVWNRFREIVSKGVEKE